MVGQKNNVVVFFNPCYYPIEEQLLETKCLFKHQDLQIAGPKLNKYNDFSSTWGCGSR